MKWVEISLTVDKDAVENVSRVLGEFGSGGAAVEELSDNDTRTYTVRAYLPERRFSKNRRRALEESLRNLEVTYPARLRVNILEPRDWLNSWKRYFKPLEVGERLLIKPTWNTTPSPAGRIAIEIDPGMAFGTGHHQTTRLCLLRLEKHLAPGMSVLDLGTGTGILAIAAARLGAGSVLALDTDPVAVSAAKENIRLNGVKDIVRVKKGTLSFSLPEYLRGHFDLAVANITADVIAGLSGRLASALKPGGILITGGIISTGLDEVLIRLAVADLKILTIDHEGEWHSVVAGK